MIVRIRDKDTAGSVRQSAGFIKTCGIVGRTRLSVAGQIADLGCIREILRLPE